MQNLAPISRPTLPRLPEPENLDINKPDLDPIYFSYYRERILNDSKAFIDELISFLQQKRMTQSPDLISYERRLYQEDAFRRNVLLCKSPNELFALRRRHLETVALEFQNLDAVLQTITVQDVIELQMEYKREKEHQFFQEVELVAKVKRRSARLNEIQHIVMARYNEVLASIKTAKQTAVTSDNNKIEYLQSEIKQVAQQNIELQQQKYKLIINGLNEFTSRLKNAVVNKIAYDPNGRAVQIRFKVELQKIARIQPFFDVRVADDSISPRRYAMALANEIGQAEILGFQLLRNQARIENPFWELLLLALKLLQKIKTVVQVQRFDRYTVQLLDQIYGLQILVCSSERDVGIQKQLEAKLKAESKDIIKKLQNDKTVVFVEDPEKLSEIDAAISAEMEFQAAAREALSIPQLIKLRDDVHAARNIAMRRALVYKVEAE